MRARKPRLRSRWIAPLTAAMACAPLAAGCGTSTPASGNGGRGSVAVLYAASLTNLMEEKVGPAFEKQTGYAFEGFPGGSEALAQQIKGKVRQGDVFLSASPQPDRDLEGSVNGGWVSWYAQFASSPLLIAYNPNSSFAAQLRRRPWWKVVSEPGFRIGRTDPRLDPKGALTVQALDEAASRHRDPALRMLAQTSADVFPEEALVGRLEAGQLDAAFLYSVEAAAARPRLPTVPIPHSGISAAYTVTVLHGAPNRAGATAFVRFLLSPGEQSALRAAGLTVSRTILMGGRGAVPAGLASTFPPPRLAHP